MFHDIAVINQIDNTLFAFVCRVLEFFVVDVCTDRNMKWPAALPPSP